MTRQHYPLACPTCGASLPHSNPMAWQFHQQRARIQAQVWAQVDRQEEKFLFDEAVERAQALGRPFEDYEVFQPAWDAGIEIVPQMDSRFILIREATGTSRRLWGLRLCLHCYERRPTVNNTYCEPCAKQLGKEYMQGQERCYRIFTRK